jgi:Condensation domain
MTVVDLPAQQAAQLVRPLDAVERHFYRYGERNPNHIVMAAEFDDVLTAERLRPALAAVQRRHPLLSAHIEDRPGTRLGFYRVGRVAPIELTIHHSHRYLWPNAAANELGRPFDRSRAPLMRVSLLQRPTSSALLLTFDHSIADGLSAVIVLNDLLRALNGKTLSNLPPPKSEEGLIASTLRQVEPLNAADLPDDPRMHTPNIIRPFDGATADIRTIAMTTVDTTGLAQRCRAESTTVHAAILIATSRARAAERGEDFVRAFSLINVRPLIGVGGDCALYLQSASTGLAPCDGTPFWEQARAMTALLKVARSAPGIVTAAHAVRQAIPIDAEADHAEAMIARMFPFEMLVSNLGVQHLDDAGPLRPTALWGPMVQNQVEGEYAIGITTYRGSLRMVTCGYNVPSTYLESVAAALVAAAEEA